MAAATRSLGVVEFYSGIGGMHFAVNESGVPYQILAAMELNDLANQVYKYNFPSDNLLQRNIEGLSVKEMEDLLADVILMSPPCQPFTRVGNQKASEDPRTKSFLHILRVLESMKKPPKYILLENVKGFETSVTRDQLIKVLKNIGYNYQEFLVSPKQFGIPNSRLRYYLLAKLMPLEFQFKTTFEPMLSLPRNQFHDGDRKSEKRCSSKNVNNEFNEKNETMNEKPPHPISEYLDKSEENEDLYLSGEVLGRLGNVLDIVTPFSTSSCCFTKAYGKYVKGTGSVITTEKTEAEIKDTYEKIETSGLIDEEKVNRLLKLKMRYFSPQEIANLMCFPKSFGFPAATTRRQKYKLLGNSINVYVVSQLLKHCLLTEKT